MSNILDKPLEVSTYALKIDTSNMLFAECLRIHQRAAWRFQRVPLQGSTERS